MNDELMELLEKANELVQKNRVYNEEFPISYISRIWYDVEAKEIFFESENDEDRIPF